MPRHVDMLTGHPGSVVLKMSLPMIVVSLSIVAFNLIDTYFVGRLGSLELAAMSYTLPVKLISGSLAMGIGIGTSSSVSGALGAGDRSSARRHVSNAHLLALAVSVALALLGLATIQPFFRMLGATDVIIPFIRRYVTIWYLGLPFVIVPLVGHNVIQSTGDTRTPAMILVLALALNVILDPILIFGLGPIPSLGIGGAALGTVLARGATALIVVRVLVRRERLVTRHIGSLVNVLRGWVHILYVGIPAAAINLLQPVSIGFVTRLISGFGAAAVAGFGVATRLESFGIVFMMALSMVFTPFAGSNHGAGTPERVRSGFRFGALYCLLWGIMVFAVFMVVAEALASVFTNDGEIMSVTARYLRVLALSYAFQGTVLLASSALNGIRRPIEAFAISFLRLIVFYIPMAAVGRAIAGIDGIFWGIAFANFVSGLIAFGWFHRTIGSVVSRREAAAIAAEVSAP